MRASLSLPLLAGLCGGLFLSALLNRFLPYLLPLSWKETR